MSAPTLTRNQRELGTAIRVSIEKGDPRTRPNAPYIGLEHIERDIGTINGYGKASEVRSTKSIFRKGDLLYGKLRPYLNKVWVAQFDGVCSTDILVYPVTNGIDNTFLKYRFMARDFVSYANEHSNGVNLPRVNAKALARFNLWLPSFHEQQRTVAEIEKQFTRLEAGVAALRRVQANLKRYRASVLKAACEGRLVPTEAEFARAEGRSYEPADQLLARILTERHKKWSGRGKYKEPVSPDPAKLQSLPEGWTWTTIDQVVVQPLCNGISIKGSDNPPGVRALRLSAMSESGFDYANARYLPLADSDVDDLWIQEGDFFMSRGNGSLHLVGRGTLAQKAPVPTIFPDTMIRLRFAREINKSGWIPTLWPSRIIRSQIEREVKTTAGIFKIAQPQVERMTIPLPPLSEQKRIVAEVQRRLSVIDQLEAVVSANLQRATRLRQSILVRAFHQNGND